MVSGTDHTLPSTTGTMTPALPTEFTMRYSGQKLQRYFYKNEGEDIERHVEHPPTPSSVERVQEDTAKIQITPKDIKDYERGTETVLLIPNLV